MPSELVVHPTGFLLECQVQPAKNRESVTMHTPMPSTFHASDTYLATLSRTMSTKHPDKTHYCMLKQQNS